MFNFSGSEIIFLLLLALIVLGPEKLPDAVRRFGRAYAEFKKVTTGFQTELKSALDEPMREMRETADALRKAASFDVTADKPSSPGPAAHTPTGAEPPLATATSGTAPPGDTAPVAAVPTPDPAPAPAADADADAASGTVAASAPDAVPGAAPVASSTPPVTPVDGTDAA